jgi:hypothetical protein
VREYRAWIAKGGESEWMPLGVHDDMDAAFTVARKRWGRRLISVRSVPTKDHPEVERRVNTL